MPKNYQTEYRKIQEELDRISQELESEIEGYLDEDFDMQWQPEDMPREALDLSQYKDLESFWNAKRSVRTVMH